MMIVLLTYIYFFIFFFFFKQKTAYEMRISDWSSDVCSSDLGPTVFRSAAVHPTQVQLPPTPATPLATTRRGKRVGGVCYLLQRSGQIGRASCRERVCQYV